jgi:hypothetical protein
MKFGLIFATFGANHLFMRNTFIFSALAIVVACGCTKTKNVIVDHNTITHDTTIVTTHDTTVYHRALLGTWTPLSVDTQTPTFTLDSLSWSGEPAYRYAASGDTIFHVYSGSTIYAEHSYYFSANYDTLFMHSTTPDRTLIFKH